MLRVKETILNFFKVLNTKKIASLSLLLALLCFAGSDAFIRFSSKSYLHHEIMFYRSSFMVVFVIIFAAVTRKLHHFKTSRFPIHMFRSFISAVSFMCTIKALSGLNLYSYKALFLMSPILVAVLGVLALKERITKKHILVFLTCLLSVFVAFQPGSDVFSLFGVFAVCSALCSAVAIFILKKLIITETTLSFILYYSLSCTIFSLFYLDLSDIDINIEKLKTFAPMALIHLIGAFSYNYAIRLLQLTSFSMIYYLALPITMSLGFVLWGEWPSNHMLLAGLLIIGSNMVLQIKVNPAKRLKQIRWFTKGESL